MNNITAATFSQQVDQLFYPDKDACRTYHVYRKGSVVLNNVSKDELETFYHACYKGDYRSHPYSFKEMKKRLEAQDNYIIEEDFNQELYDTLRSDYTIAQCKIDSDFRNYLYSKFDVVDNPKNLKCFELAWTYGHSSGYSEVESYFHDLVELIK